MKYRNPTYTINNWIKCEIEHPIHGWIPFTADPNDAGAEFDVAELYQRMLNDPNTLPYIEPPILPPTRKEQEANRQAAYSLEADPIAMQMLRGEATQEEWLAKINEIKLRYPYPEESEL